MKKIITTAIFFVTFLFELNAQTIPTSTVTGSLKINDSLNVTNNIQTAGDVSAIGNITATGEVTAKDTLRAQKDIIVDGNAKIAGALDVVGITNLFGDVYLPTLKLGTVGSNINISSQTTLGGAKILGFGYPGGPPPMPTTCIAPFSAGFLAAFNGRAAITQTTGTGSLNVLDFNNDGLNGYIDYGYDISLHPILSGSITPIPALKINSACWGDVEIAKGGGYVSMGHYIEVGNPIRSNIASNILASGGKIGQRVTFNSVFPIGFASPTSQYNTQLFANRDFVRALAVFNTQSNPSGVETFVVFGNGKTQIGIGKPLATGVAANAMLSVDGLILAKEVRVAISTSTHWADYVFEKKYKLMSLKDLETYIKINKHLPDVPSEIDVKENGIDVTEISATLLKKIEELTLYTIELQKKLEKQQLEINALKK
jgi:hypothetical protein